MTRVLVLLVLAALSSGVAAQSSPAAPAETSSPPSVASPDLPGGVPEYPRTVELAGGVVTIHPPQIRAWDNFQTIEGLAVVEAIVGNATEPRFGVLAFSADAVPDIDARLVTIENVSITSLTEQGEEVDESVRLLFETAFPIGARQIPLDLVLSHLAYGVLPTSTPGIKKQPPKIFVSTTPAIIVLLQGEPVLAPIGESGLKFAANTNWSLFKIETSGEWFLRNNEEWLVTTSLEDPWTWPAELPAAIQNLPDDDNWRSTSAAAAAWQGMPDTDPPTVFVYTEPAELILLDGEAKLTEIEGTDLAYVENTESQVFKYDNRWYYLVSGRWFVNKSLDENWRAVQKLPEAFATIPEDHGKADVLASVPGTPAAQIATLDAQIPKKTEVALRVSMPETVTYAGGTPNFEPIPETTLKRAVNTSYEVFEVGSEYYLCYSGMWYFSNTPTGPWSVASSVPDAIYTIPTSSPAYHTTYVRVYETSPVSVTFGYTSGYSSVYIVNGVPVYGTGWYYPPYYYYGGGYPVYYGYPYTYGSASYYNPRTGTYGSVSRAYGPYGGWGYASAYNPRTGTYGRAESVWDYDEWYGVGEAYNPRTGRYYGTERYYDADDGDWKVNSTLEGPRGEVDISRRFDADSGVATISTSAGGEGTFTRRSSNGGTDTASEFTTADGRTVTGEGRFEDGEGRAELSGSGGGEGTIDRSVDADAVTREGSFSRDGKTLTTETNRDGSGPTTKFETSEGAQGVVSGSALNRTAVAESASGDLYASRNGNVWKKTDDGWSQRTDDGWSQIDSSGRVSQSSTRTTERSEIGNQASQRAATNTRANTTRNNTSFNNNYSNLNRDFSARQRGTSRSQNFNRQYSGRRGGARRR